MYLYELVGEVDDFARYEANAVASSVRPLAPGLAIAETAPSLVESLGYTRHVSTYIGACDPTPDAAAAALAAHSIDRSGTVAVRARSIRGMQVDTQAVERTVGTVLDDGGFSIDLESPEHELRIVFSGDQGYIGWEYCTPTPNFSKRRPADRPFFQPGSMEPRLARALVMIVGGKPGRRILDPMCGTGGILLEAGLIGMDVLASDVQDKMIRGTQRNFDTLVPNGSLAVFRASAAALPLDANSCDAVVFDAPYGRQSPIRDDEQSTLLDNTLAEAQRVAPRAVVVSDRPIDETLALAGWTIRANFTHQVHRSLDRYIYDLEATEVTGK